MALQRAHQELFNVCSVYSSHFQLVVYRCSHVRIWWQPTSSRRKHIDYARWGNLKIAWMPWGPNERLQAAPTKQEAIANLKCRNATTCTLPQAGGDSSSPAVRGYDIKAHGTNGLGEWWFIFVFSKTNTVQPTHTHTYIIIYIYIACAPGFSCSPRRLQHSSCNQEVHTLIVHKHAHSLDLWVSFPNMNGHAHSVSGLMWGGAHQHLDATFSRSFGKNGEKQFLLGAAKETWFISRFDSFITRWIYVT